MPKPVRGVKGEGGREGSTAGDDRTDFDLVLVVEHLVFSHEFITAYNQVSFDDEIEFFEEVFRLLRAFDLNGS